MTINTIIIDIETLDTAPTAIILSIAAFAFDRYDLNSTLSSIEIATDEERYGENHFYCKCSLIDQLINSKRTINQQTLNWWRTQHIDTIQHHFNLFSNPPLENALTELISKITEWKKLNPSVIFYCRGTNFDPIILNNAFGEYSLQIPWKYNKIRDIRTYIDALQKTNLGYIENYEPSFHCMNHIALHDALRDAEQMCIAHNNNLVNR